jgi:hypothetical protein
MKIAYRAGFHTPKIANVKEIPYRGEVFVLNGKRYRVLHIFPPRSHHNRMPIPLLKLKFEADPNLT